MTGAMAAVDAATDFRLFVDNLARQLIGLSPTFEAFVAAMPGVPPDEALAALRRLRGQSARRLIADAKTDRAAATIDQCALLPLPHPLDSEFRFDGTTAALLARALIDSTRDGDEILLIGVPTVALELASTSVDRKIRFLGPDNCVSAAVKWAFADKRLLLDPGLGGSAAAALLDPPWYARPMAELIQVCAAGCREGALVKLVLPPLGTRPEITAESAYFQAFAAKVGFSPTGAEGPVCYRTPLFELAAMERQGIARLPSWRRGEALEFVAHGATRPQSWVAPRATELSVGGVRLRLVRGARRGSATLMPVDRHEVFPSVSSRAPGRALATLWTTTNRAFVVDYDLALAALAEISLFPGVLQSGIGTQESDLPLASHVARREGLIHQLVELIGRELDDARRLVGDCAWLKTEMEWRS